jgi:hypothetical protein
MIRVCYRFVVRMMSGSILFFLATTLLGAQTNTSGVLDAKGGHAVVPHSPGLVLVPRMTLEAWVCPAPPHYSFGAIVDKNKNTGFTFGVSALLGRKDSVTLSVGTPSGWLAGPRISCDSVTWTHVAVTLDTVARKAAFYVNGALSKTLSGVTIGALNNSADLRIATSVAGDAFWGLCDEVRIWNIARTGPEIAGSWQHEAKGNDVGLVAVYHFEDVRDTVAWNRAAGGGLHGALSAPHILIEQPFPLAYTEEHEPNGMASLATPVGYKSAILTATSAPADTDYYKIFTRPGDILRVETAAKSAGDPGGLFINIIGPDTVTFVTNQLGSFPSFYTAASLPGYRYVRVSNNSGTAIGYTLLTGLSGEIVSDPFEPNEDRTQATPRTWGTRTYGSNFPGLDGRTADPDSDYYSVSGVEGEIGLFSKSLQGLSSGSTTTKVYGPSGLMAKSYPNSSQNVRFPSTGTYYVAILPNESASRYDLALFKGLADINRMLYDPMTFGSYVYLLDGWNDAYDGAYQLKIDNMSYQADCDYAQTEIDGRQFVFGPAAMSGLTVSRKFFVPTTAQGDTLGYMRIQDILTNSTASPITVDVCITSNFGSGNGNRIRATSSGDTLFTKDDRWLVTDDGVVPGGDPALVHCIDGVGGLDRIDSVWYSTDTFYWWWKNVRVEPGQTKIYMYYVSQDSLVTNADKKGPAFSRAQLPAGAKLGLGADAARVMNWPTDALVSAGEEGLLPASFGLDQNYPNPFNPVTTIRGQWTEASDVQVTVFDLLGRRVAVLGNGRFAAGGHTFRFDATGVASGVYLYRLEARSASKVFVDVKKMIVIK